MKTRIVCAAVAALSLAAASSAHADTLVVDQSAGPYTTIGAAVDVASYGDVIAIHAGRYAESVAISEAGVTLRGEPGVEIASTAPFAVSMTGRLDRLADVTVTGSQGGVHIEGQDTSVSQSIVRAGDRAIDVDGGAVTVYRSVIRADDPAGTAIVAAQPLPAPAKVVLHVSASVVSGGAQGTGLDVTTGTTGDAGPVGTAEAHLVDVTIAGAPTAVRTAQTGMGGTVTVKAYNSIVHGTGDVIGAGNERSASDAATFADPANQDFHLRADSPALHLSVFLPPGESLPDRDLAGIPLPIGLAGIAVGALQFTGRPPVAMLTGPATAQVGEPVDFSAAGSSDPDPGGSITSYTWRFGDGTPDVLTTEPTVRHTFLKPGAHAVSVRVHDVTNVEVWSAPLAVGVTDTTAPAMTVSSPKPGAVVKRYRVVKGRHGHDARRVVNVMKFGGVVSDASGVRGVTVSLQRTRPKPTKGRCTFLDAARRRIVTERCGARPATAAHVAAGRWSWHTPATLAVPAGRWTLTVRAVDRAGNATTKVLHFTVT